MNNKPIGVFSQYHATIAFPTAFFIYIFVDNNVDPTLLTNIYLLNMVLIFLLEYPAGVVSDYWGRKWAMIGSNVCFMITYLSALLSQNTFFVFLYSVTYALALTLRSGTINSWIQEFTQKTNNHHAEFQRFEIWGIYARMLGALAGFLVFLFSSSYSISISLLLLMYLVSSFFFASLEENHQRERDQPITSNLKKSFGFILKNKLLSLFFILCSGSIFLLSTPIFMYYPISIDIFLDGDRQMSVVAVLITFLLMNVTSILITKFVNKKTRKKQDDVYKYSILAGILLALTSPLMYFLYLHKLIWITFLLPIFCSGLFTVVTVTFNSIITDKLKTAGIEKNMVTVMSTFSSLGMIIFSILYLAVNILTTENDYSRFVVHYYLILPLGAIFSISIYFIRNR